MSEIDEVRNNLGKTSSSNLTDLEIDLGLTYAEDQVLEDTGFNTLSDPAYEKPNLIEKLKVLNATAYLLIRFADKIDLRNSILKQIEGMNYKITHPMLSDDEDDAIIEGIDYQTYPLNPNGGFYKPTTVRNQLHPNSSDNPGVRI